MAVVHIDSDEEFQTHFQGAGNKLVVIDFFATWCGPCRVIAPVFEQLAGEHPEVLFLKVDVDQCTRTAQLYGIRAMPTFLFIRNTRKLHTIQGARDSELKSKVQELAASGPNEQQEDCGVLGMVNLFSLINTSQVSCLNESDDHTVKNILEKNTDLYLESDCDPELLIFFEFIQNVKLHSLKVLAPWEHAPKTIKLFINQPHTMDFDGARDGKAVQELNLTKDDVTEEAIINLKFVKFQNVNNVTLFISDNQGDEENTKIQNLTFIGKPVAVTNMSEFKRVSGKQGESH